MGPGAQDSWVVFPLFSFASLSSSFASSYWFNHFTRQKQVDGDPDNNWFNLPSLWTTGFNSNPNALLNSRSADTGGEPLTVFARMVVYLRRFMMPYLTLLMSIYFLEVSITTKNVLQPILRGKFIILKYTVIRALTPILVLKQLDLLASKVLGWPEQSGTAKLSLAVGLVLSMISLLLRLRMWEDSWWIILVYY